MIRLYKQSDGTLISIDESSQKSTMPTASADFVGKIYQYIGATDANYTNGHFYKCKALATNPVTYKWEQVDVQESGTPRKEKQITTANDFRTAQGSYSFITTTAVTITLADAETVSIPANTQGFFDVGETDENTDDYAGVIRYVLNGREKTIYFNSLTFTLPATDSVQIDDTTASTTSTYSSSKIETAIGGSKAAQMTGATAYQDGKAGLATKPVAGDNQKALFGDGRYHTIYAANTGSTIIVVTDESTLYGRPVTLTAGATTLTGSFDSTGECTFTNLALYGAVQVSSTDAEGSPAKGSTNITYFGTYVVGVGFNFATIKLTSSEIALAGVPVALYFNDEVVAETSLRSTGYGELEATVYVEKFGTYKAVATGTEKTARATINVTTIRAVYEAELITGYLPNTNSQDIICEAYGDNFNDGSLSWGDGTSPVIFDLNGGTVAPTLQEDNSVYIPVASNNIFASSDLGAASTPFTAYAVMKLQNPSQYARLISSFSARSAGSGIQLQGNNNINISSWGSDTATGVSPLNYVVVAMQFIEPGVGRGFVRGYAQVYADKPSQTAGRYVTIGRTDIEQGGAYPEPCDVFVKYFAVVNEVESIQTVQANMEYLNTIFLEG